MMWIKKSSQNKVLYIGFLLFETFLKSQAKEFDDFLLFPSFPGFYHGEKIYPWVAELGSIVEYTF